MHTLRTKTLTPPAKKRANAVHNRLKTLCHNWMTKHRPELVDRLRERARREIKTKENRNG